jgi:hypothetical protein
MTGCVDLAKWHDLYRAALFETDQRNLPTRIFVAEQALRERSRELFAMHGGSAQEAQEIDDALYALKALRNCLKLGTRDDKVA